ncbi:MAG: polysaccharide deacetylase family protein [Candidatus Pacearchaeota archaeon]
MKKVILTFDDGPSERFTELLDYLENNGHKAIFFCKGKNLEGKISRKNAINAIKKGHLVENHSYSHPNFNSISYRRGKEEILKTDRIIEEIYNEAGVKRNKKLFRFPYFCKGVFNFFNYQKLLKENGYNDPYFGRRFFDKPVAVTGTYHFLHSMVLGKYDVYCDIDPKDWDTKISFSIVKKTLDNAKDGDVITLHDHRENLERDKQICDYLSSKGFILSY